MALISAIVAIAGRWKQEACSSTWTSLYNAGYDAFEPDHSEANARGYVALALLLFSVPVWAVPTKQTLIIIAAGWFLLNEGIISLAKTRCPGHVGNHKIGIGSGIFASYLAAVFTTWVHSMKQ